MAEEQAPDPQANLGRDVFISYASHDKAVADAACKALESAGVACWIAPRDVTPGEFYAESIVHAIDSAKVIVLVLSQNGAASQHVLREVERASSKRHPVVSFRIDAAPLPAGLEYFLNSSQWLDASPTGPARALPRLVDAVKSALAQPSATEQVGKGQSATTTTNQRRHRMLVGSCAIILATLAFLAADKFLLSKRITTPQAEASIARSSNPPEVAIAEKSIAVLPFADMSEKHDQEYFGDGMAEEILNVLAKIPGLTVIGRTSSFQFKGKNEDLRTIGAKLNAAHVLEGSVRQSGDQLRITAQLINTRTGAHEWSETYDRPIGDVLKLQDAIATSIVRELQLSVTSGYLNSRSTVNNAEAYDLYLRGAHAYGRYDGEGFDDAVNLFKQALDRDPTFADAAVLLAWAYESQAEWGYLAPAVGFEQARRAAMMALRLDPRRAEAHAVLAAIHVIYDWDWVAAETEIQLAFTLAPGNADSLEIAAYLSGALGRWDDALQQAKDYLAKEPLDPGGFVVLSDIQVRRGHLPEAEAAARQVLEILPTYAFGHYFLGRALLARGDRNGALVAMQQESNDDGKQLGLALGYYAIGRKAESDAALARVVKEQADRNAFAIAEVYSFRGQSDAAMDWLVRAYAQKDPLLNSVKGDPLLKNLEADARFKAFLRKMNLPE